MFTKELVGLTDLAGERCQTHQLFFPSLSISLSFFRPYHVLITTTREWMPSPLPDSCLEDRGRPALVLQVNVFNG